LASHHIDTGNHPPIAEPLRRHPKIYLDVIDDSINRLVDAGICEPCNLPWAANIVLVKKKDSAVPRVTVDFRKLNEITLKDKFPLPRISDCLDALSGAVYFSSIDQSHSFFQLPLATEEDRNKTAFITRRGQFRFTRLPMGASNSPSVFARLMTLVLYGLTYLCCLVFNDDCIVMSRSFDDHLHHVGLVLQRFRQARLKLKPSKCHLFQRRLKFLGHIVSGQGVEVNPDKVATILAWPFPQNITELRGFLELCNYYRSFCPNFSAVVEPLSEMLHKGVRIEPTERRMAAFNALKAMLTTPPTLAMPNDEGEWVVDVDCSAFAMGAVAQQWQNGELKVIEYASRTLNRAERSYCATRRDCWR